MTDQTDLTDQTDRSGSTPSTPTIPQPLPDSPRPGTDDYRQVSLHLKAAGEEVRQLLDVLTEGLAVEAQVRRDAAHPDSTPDSSTRETSGPGAGETR